MHDLHLVHVRDEQGRWFVNMIFVRAPPNHKGVSLYLILNDERFPNALLSASLLPSTSVHLF
jgi:hypothetical protein